MQFLRRHASGVESFSLPSGRVVNVPKFLMRFREWARKNEKGTPLNLEGRPIDTYHRKPVLDYRGEPVFAELAILRLLESEGWEGRWVDSFGGVKFRTGLLDRPLCVLPAGPKALFDKIASAKGSRGGCWDVFAWRGKEFLFAEAKRVKEDKIRDASYRYSRPCPSPTPPAPGRGEGIYRESRLDRVSGVRAP